MAEITDQVTDWKVGGRSVQASTKIPHIPAQRTNDKMSDDQKRGVSMWNLMRKTLLDNGLMEEK